MPPLSGRCTSPVIFSSTSTYLPFWALAVFFLSILPSPFFHFFFIFSYNLLYFSFAFPACAAWAMEQRASHTRTVKSTLTHHVFFFLCHAGDILIFLTGRGEIDRAVNELYRRSETLDYDRDVRQGGGWSQNTKKNSREDKRKR